MVPRNAGQPEPLSYVPGPDSNPNLSRLSYPGRSSLGDSAGGLRALPAPRASGPDPQALLGALGRRWALALSLGLVLATAAGATVWFLFSNRYTVTAQVHVSASVAPIGDMLPDDRTGQGVYATYQKTQMQRLKNPFILSKALAQEDVKRLALVADQPEPLQWLMEEIRVETQEGSEFVTLSMVGRAPQDMEKILNAIMTAYLDEYGENERTARSRQIKRLEEGVQSLTQTMEKKQKELEKQQKEQGSTDSSVLGARQITLMGELTELTRQQSGLRGNLLNARITKQTLETELKSLDKSPVDEAFVNTQIEERLKDLIAAEFKIKLEIERELGRGARRTDTAVLQANAQLDRVRGELDERRTAMRKEITEGLRRKRKADLESQLAMLGMKVQAEAEAEKLLTAQIQSKREEASKVTASSGTMTNLVAEITFHQERHKELSRTLEKLNLEQSRPPRVSEGQKALAQKKDMKRLVLMCVAAPLATFGLTCLGVALWDYRARRVHSTDEVIKDLGLRLVGTVPAISRAREQSAENPEAVNHGLLESIDSIRTVLLRSASVEPLRVVMVSSAVSGEGKTLLAAHLASSLARAGRRTLLVDCDLRQPALHQLFEQALQPGFSEVLLGEVNLAEAVRPTTAVDGLWLLPAGQWDREVIQALARDGLQDIFDRLKREFDFVVVDSHPVLAATDALVIGQQTDAVLLSLLREVSQVPRVDAAAQRLTNLGIRVLGAVVHGMSGEETYGGLPRSVARIAA